jgi:HK97 family phage portal protein
MRFNPFRKKALTATPEIVEMAAARTLQPYRSLGGTNIDTQRISSVFVQHQSASYAWLYTHQPAVRTVVDYVARNIAQLGLKVYDRISDDEREHVGDHPAARVLRQPNGWTPSQQFIFTLVADFLVYDNAYVLKIKAGPQSQLVLVNVPASAVGILGQQRFVAEGYRIYRADGTSFDVPSTDVLHWRGYDPNEPRMGVSKLETLREELASDAAARTAKTELDRAGGVPKGWIERPLEAPVLSPEAEERFLATWGNWTANPRRSTPLLEEGMQFKQSELSPAEQQMLESRQFTMSQAAAIFGLGNIPPKDEEERQQVYADVLRPYCEMLCSYLDLSILLGEFGEDTLYSEFNLDEKYMGDNRLKALTSASGRPVMLTNEARARINLPPVDGGDELVTPANVIVGDNPKPSIDLNPIQDPNKPPDDGSHRTDQPKALAKALPDNFEIAVPKWEHRHQADLARQHRYTDEVAAKMARFYSRQENVLRHKSEGKMDLDRWDRELAEDLKSLIRSIVEREGGLYVARLLGDDFDLRQVEHYLTAQAEGAAEGINRATQRDIEELGVVAAMERAQNLRVGTAAASIGTRATLFARTEAAKQAPNPDRRLKTWVADTDRHASLNGASVPLDRDWGGISPGSQPNCKCTAVIS